MGKDASSLGFQRKVTKCEQEGIFYECWRNAEET